MWSRDIGSYQFIRKSDLFGNFVYHSSQKDIVIIFSFLSKDELSGTYTIKTRLVGDAAFVNLLMAVESSVTRSTGTAIPQRRQLCYTWLSRTDTSVLTGFVRTRDVMRGRRA